MGMFISILVDKVEDTGPLNPIIMLPMMNVAGFFVSISNISWPLYILSFIAPP